MLDCYLFRIIVFQEAFKVFLGPLQNENLKVRKFKV